MAPSLSPPPDCFKPNGEFAYPPILTDEAADVLAETLAGIYAPTSSSEQLARRIQSEPYVLLRTRNPAVVDRDGVASALVRTAVLRGTTQTTATYLDSGDELVTVRTTTPDGTCRAAVDPFGFCSFADGEFVRVDFLGLAPPDASLAIT